MASSINEKNKKFILISSDNEKIEVSNAVIKESQVLTQMIGVMTTKTDPIPLPTISSTIIKQIKIFCEKFENSPTYSIPFGHISNPMPWLEALGDCEGDNLVELLQAANFLDIPRLIDAGLLKIKSFIDGQSIENIRAILNLPADLNSEEEQKIADKHVWNVIDPREDE